MDFSSIPSDWTSKKGIYDPDNVVERARQVRRWLRERPEDEIVVVAHGDILRTIADGDPNSWRVSHSQTALTVRNGTMPRANSSRSSLTMTRTLRSSSSRMKSSLEVTTKEAAAKPRHRSKTIDNFAYDSATLRRPRALRRRSLRSDHQRL